MLSGRLGFTASLSMSQSGYDKSNASRESSATDVVDALLKQKARGESGLAARRHVRKRWTVEIQVRIEETVELHKTSRELRVTTQDLSRGGFSFLCRHFVYPGSQVWARITSLPGNPVLMGTVANCSYAGAGKHRVGVKLLGLNT